MRILTENNHDKYWKLKRLKSPTVNTTLAAQESGAQFNGPMKELLRNTPILITWQQSDNTLRETLCVPTEGHDLVNDRVHTLVIKQKKFIDANNGGITKVSFNMLKLLYRFV